MKNCQVQKKQKLNKTNKFFFFFNKKLRQISVFGCLVFILIGSILLQPGLVKGAVPITVDDPAAKLQREKIAAGDQSSFWEKFTWEKLREQAWGQGSTLYKRALAYFLNQLAYDTAIKLATGDWGQNPLIEHRTFKDVFRETADNAAGYFIEELGQQGFGGVKFNLCEPDFAIKYKITLGLQKYHKPPKPACTFSQMKENWEEALRGEDFLSKFQDSFNPWENDLGIALSLQAGLGSEVDKKANEAGLEKLANQGFKPVTDPVSGFIKTPASVVRDFTQNTISKSSNDYFVYTGYALADVIDVFINTLLGTLMEEWLNKGIVTDFPELKSWEYDDNYESQTGREGIAAAKQRFRKLIEPSFNVRGDYNILAELTMCPDPTKAGPTNCVITDNFRQAVINKLTVGQAMEDGYLDSNWIFGFTADGLEPSYMEGYPYRSMKILRKFRIIPVGWEIAAQYIKDYLGETRNLGDLVACYDLNDDYEGYYASWCEGLIDPNWVLKAPLNYCKREGSGPEIISETVSGSGDDSELSITRNSNYCADEQSCIKENNDGSCQLYGYCTEEKRKWQFNGKSCEPKYNTCQIFRSRDSAIGGTGGQTVSYLENTLDYGICSYDNAGCQPYCTDFDFASGSWDCTLASVGDKLYLDSDVEECDEENEGCHEFIRVKAGVGANLLKNSSFEDYSGTVDDGAADDFDEWGIIGEAVSDSYNGLIALQLSGNLNATIDIAPTDYTIAGDIFTLSFYAKNCTAGDDFNINGEAIKELNDGSDWQYYQTTYIYPETASGYQVSFGINTNSCIIDAIKLEQGINATAYSDYRAAGLVYQKLAPDYLNCSGSATLPECNNFVRQCSASDVGCELYTSSSDNMSIPAKVKAQDYCPAECVGYDAYIQDETIFDSLRAAYFIPRTAKTCGVKSVGCDQFTNLDEVAQGGEGIEYYSYLRQCIKPSDPDADCTEFYTWEGSDETGYQLKVHILQQNAGEPAVTEDDSLECNADIYSLPATDPAYNSDCREFYNNSGGISYHLYKRTISCDNNCYPYRRTENNIDPTLDAESCSADGSGYLNVSDDQFYWDADLSVCYFCKSHGEWSVQHEACIYMAIPGQGISCSAAENGCREYKGNTGNNMRIVLNNDFEGSMQGWVGVGGTIVNLSNEALTTGGNSLYVSEGIFSASNMVGNLVQKNKSYVLSFIAKSNGASQINSIRLINSAGDEAGFTSVVLSADWQLYKVNLAVLDHNVDESENLVITANGNFYIDDIRLTEITDRYYLIKNSWVTPDSCYEDIQGNFMGPYYNAGCDEYYDRSNNAHYLRSFNQLCYESVVGCEIMIDTHNLTNYNSETFNIGDPSQVVVPADSFAYVVYDQKKQCNRRDKGCERLGAPYQYANNVLYGDVYAKNNPDKYNRILCEAGAVGCEEWTANDGTAYFKDPGDQVCEWRQAAGVAEGGWGWYKKKVKRCDDNGNGIIDAAEAAVCLNSNDCESGISCILDNNDYGCSVSSYKTLGIGGTGNAVQQPTFDLDGNWVGLCPSAQAGCSEYVDPTSRFSVNLVFNADFSQDVDSDGIADGWSASANGEQDIALKANTLHILAVEDNNTATLDAVNNDFYRLESNNYLIGPVNQISITSSAGSRASRPFYTRTNVSGKITVNSAVPNNGSKVELKQAIVDYQLKQDLDKQSCNGIVDFEQGCVLFNERSQNGPGLAGLDWDADLTVDDSYGVTPEAGELSERDSNILIKVSPDRVCNKWLACRSYIKDESDNNVCFDIGFCNSVNENGNCNNFVIADKVNQTYPNLVDADIINNMSGYIKAGYNNNSLNSDLYPLTAMKQVGQAAKVSNGNFEFTGSNGYPIGWIWLGGTWDENVFIVIDNPYSAQVEGIGHAPEGNNFLKLGAAYSATSEIIEIEPNIKSVLTAYINTINLSGGQAKVKIEQFNRSNNLIAINNNVVTISAGNDWTFKLGNFTTVANASRIRITLYVDGSDVTGNYYFDDVKIMPALDSKWDTVLAQEWYTPQTCRLYPQDDSLSCDYYDDSGMRQKGWLGYCLEYDHYPGSKDACLLWWPVDKIKGEGIEEGAGYLGKFPVYYCIEAEGVLIYPSSYDSKGPYNVFWANQTDHGDLSRTFITNYMKQVVPGRNYEVRDAWGRSTPPYIRENNENQLRIGMDDGPINGESRYGFELWDLSLNQMVFEWDGNVDVNLDIIFTPIYFYCGRVVQTVTAAGQNKYWSGRVYKGSNYTVPDLDYIYTTDDPPFGSIVPPYPVVNPYEWDGDSDKGGIQPIYTDPENEIRAANPYSCNLVIDGNNICDDADWLLTINPVTVSTVNGAVDRVKRLFAQSYGVWAWNGDHDNGIYEPVGGQDWNPPNTTCPSGIRLDYPNDWCAVVPTVNNIKVNNQVNNFTINNNQFVNLRFNSDVDSQQLPLIMYAVNWGDNEYTVVTGVEMRNRSNPDNPHSLYHLYGYWDLKAKQAFDQDDPITAENENTVYCGDAGGDALNYDGVDSGFNCPAESSCCVIKPSVKIKDNWGWCNNGVDGTPCPSGGYQPFGGWIVVKEK